MTVLEGSEGLSECIERAIQEHLARSNIDLAWPQLNGLVHPILRVEAFLEDAAPSPTTPNATVQASRKVASVCTLFLASMSFIVQYRRNH